MDQHADLLTAVPSLGRTTEVTVTAHATGPAAATATGRFVAPGQTVDGIEPRTLDALGFDAAVVGSTATLASSTVPGAIDVLVGIGESAEFGPAVARRAAAAFARAAGNHTHLCLTLPDGPGAQAIAQACVEGILLARYRYDGQRRSAQGTEVATVDLVVPAGDVGAAAAGGERGRRFAAAELVARDLANTPHSHLTATMLGEIAVALGDHGGFEVELFDRDALTELGCGGLLAINAGSVEPPLMIKLRYRPAGAAIAHIALVGKGVMYDSGGISLKPSDPVHARMKSDMSGAASCLAAVAALPGLDAGVAVTAYLMCTDNMPSGTATALGDVITIRGGTTVEMIDTDAEGRVIMADALALAAEEHPDAIVDIATLTGSCSRALGTDLAGVFGTDQGLIDRAIAAGNASDELLWQLPLHRPYRKLLDSQVADIANCGPIGLPDAILAALYLAEFTGDVPWAHIDIAGTAWSDDDNGWRTKGATAFGTRLLLELTASFGAATG